MVLNYLLSHGLPILVVAGVLGLGLAMALRGRRRPGGRPPGDRP